MVVLASGVGTFLWCCATECGEVVAELSLKGAHFLTIFPASNSNSSSSSSSSSVSFVIFFVFDNNKIRGQQRATRQPGKRVFQWSAALWLKRALIGKAITVVFWTHVFSIFFFYQSFILQVYKDNFQTLSDAIFQKISEKNKNLLNIWLWYQSINQSINQSIDRMTPPFRKK